MVDTTNTMTVVDGMTAIGTADTAGGATLVGHIANKEYGLAFRASIDSFRCSLFYLVFCSHFPFLLQCVGAILGEYRRSNTSALSSNG